MAGLNDTDIRLDESWQLTQSRTGDAPTCTGTDCFVQDIRLESITQPGELFYDSEWGWGLLEFLHSEDDDFTQLEISERIKEKLGRRSEVDAQSIEIDISFEQDYIQVFVAFRFADSSTTQSLNLELNRVSVEVVLVE